MNTSDAIGLDAGEVVTLMSGWFDSMRDSNGYGGPVSHWWRDSLRYCGSGIDWRYEGIILGYLTLWERTDDDEWLDRALRAADDVVDGQLATGNFRASAFERNPETVGTPHEAAVSVALLRLVAALDETECDADPYVEAARSNVKWHEEVLWNEQDQTFSDSPGARSYVPNKIATTAEAFLDLACVRERDELIDARVVPAMDAVRDFQIQRGDTRGAIHQLAVPRNGRIQGDGKFFPIYIARCIPPLLRVDEFVDDDRFEDTAIAAGEFLARTMNADGSFPAVVYADGSQNPYPRWIAALGDVLRAFDALAAAGHEFETEATERWLLEGFDDCGAFRTAYGFGRLHGVHDGWAFRDVLHVAGWNDKAFRWLATRVSDDPTPHERSAVSPMSHRCRLRGQAGVFTEDGSTVSFSPSESPAPAYSWTKGDTWARLDEP